MTDMQSIVLSNGTTYRELRFACYPDSNNAFINNYSIRCRVCVKFDVAKQLWVVTGAESETYDDISMVVTEADNLALALARFPEAFMMWLLNKRILLTGECHPLVRLFSEPGDSESNQRLEEGMKDYRKMIDGLQIDR